MAVNSINRGREQPTYKNGFVVPSENLNLFPTYGWMPGLGLGGLSDLKDIGRNGKTGILTGSWAIADKVYSNERQAIWCRGNDEYVSTSLQNMGWNHGTITWWVNPRDAFDDGTIHGMWGHITASSTLPSFDAQKFSDDSFYVGFNDDTPPNDDRVSVAASATNYVINEWNFYCFTWINGGISRLYHNGVEIGDNGGGTDAVDIARNFEIGRQNETSYWNAIIDDFFIYKNRVLSIGEIKRLFYLRRGGIFEQKPMVLGMLPVTAGTRWNITGDKANHNSGTNVLWEVKDFT